MRWKHCVTLVGGGSFKLRAKPNKYLSVFDKAAFAVQVLGMGTVGLLQIKKTSYCGDVVMVRALVTKQNCLVNIRVCHVTCCYCTASAQQEPNQE